MIITVNLFLLFKISCYFLLIFVDLIDDYVHATSTTLILYDMCDYWNSMRQMYQYSQVKCSIE